MLSFSRLGEYGRLGNQLFQYAFLRTQAEKLGVNFYCPHWIGDEIFELADQQNRSPYPTNIRYFFQESSCMSDDALVRDNSEIVGYFESEKHFDVDKVSKWYTFQESKICHVRDKYSFVAFSQSVGLHLRLGDKKHSTYFQNIYYIPRVKYYIESLQHVRQFSTVLVFSDDIVAAREYFTDIVSSNWVFVEGNADWEDLYLMAQCHDFICGASTLSWWGAWLGEKGVVIFPQEGTRRPAIRRRDIFLIPYRWHKISALFPLRDNYVFRAFPLYDVHHRCIIFMGKVLKKYFPKIFNFLVAYFR